jgi:hypothetical protein
MTKLSSAARKGLPTRDFAGPARSFPVEDDSHAREAISGATRSERAGNISAGEEDSIKAKARAKLRDTRPKDHQHPRDHDEFERLGRD